MMCVKRSGRKTYKVNPIKGFQVLKSIFPLIYYGIWGGKVVIWYDKYIINGLIIYSI